MTKERVELACLPLDLGRYQEQDGVVLDLAGCRRVGLRNRLFCDWRHLQELDELVARSAIQDLVGLVGDFARAHEPLGLCSGLRRDEVDRPDLELFAGFNAVLGHGSSSRVKDAETIERAEQLGCAMLARSGCVVVIVGPDVREDARAFLPAPGALALAVTDTLVLTRRKGIAAL
jgi:hypothetical protein